MVVAAAHEQFGCYYPSLQAHEHFTSQSSPLHHLVHLPHQPLSRYVPSSHTFSLPSFPSPSFSSSPTPPSMPFGSDPPIPIDPTFRPTISLPTYDSLPVTVWLGISRRFLMGDVWVERQKRFCLFFARRDRSL